MLSVTTLAASSEKTAQLSTFIENNSCNISFLLSDVSYLIYTTPCSIPTPIFYHFCWDGWIRTDRKNSSGRICPLRKRGWVCWWILTLLSAAPGSRRSTPSLLALLGGERCEEGLGQL